MKIEITEVQRQILLNQYRIMRKLDVDDEYGNQKDINRSIDILFRGLEYNYDEVVSTKDQISEEVSKKVISYMDVYDACAAGYFNDKGSFEDNLLGNIKRFGFDGNDTANFDYYKYATWLINNGSFPSLAKLLSSKQKQDSNININSHGMGPSISDYEEQVARYNDIIHSDDYRESGLTAENVKYILKENL